MRCDVCGGAWDSQMTAMMRFMIAKDVTMRKSRKKSTIPGSCRITCRVEAKVFADTF